VNKKLNALLGFFIVALCISCANKVAPQGGDRDVKPPVLLSAVPAENSVNFNASEVVLTFDEYVQLKEVTKQIIISPLLNPAPEFLVRKKSVIIKFNSPLLPATTYTISFGNAITDNNEGNTLTAYRYVFSTGDYLDSLLISGAIADASTGKSAEGVLALLYRSPVADSVPLKKAPDYFAKTDATGKFTITNVAAGNYALYALEDKNGNFILDAADERAGFFSDIVNAIDSTQKELVVARQPLSRQSVKSSIIEEPGKLTTVFSRPTENPKPVFADGYTGKFIIQKNVLKDTIVLYTTPEMSDSAKVIWYDGEVVIDTVGYRKQRGSVTPNKSYFSGFPFPQKGNPLPGGSNPAVTWTIPTASIDTTKILVTRDSVAIHPGIAFTDSLQTKMQFAGEWKSGSYAIQILPGAVTDIHGRSHDTISWSFNAAGDKGRGSITYKLSGTINENFILQLVNEKDEIVRQHDGKSDYTGIFSEVEPGIYRIRIVFDRNGNKLWDGGDVLRRITPEKIYYHTEIITVRANWDVETEVKWLIK
jgi:hypothetical protein